MTPLLAALVLAMSPPPVGASTSPTDCAFVVDTQHGATAFYYPSGMLIYFIAEPIIASYMIMPGSQTVWTYPRGEVEARPVRPDEWSPFVWVCGDE